MPEVLTHSPESKELADNCEIVVCIPVAGHQEGANIYRTLESYTNQTLPTDKFEINLYVNKPIQDQEGNPIEWDETLNEIERFKVDFPDIHIVVETEEFGPGEFTIGKVRHNQAKKVLQRSVARDNAERDIILVSNDADNKGVTPTYLENFLTKFEEQPETSAFLGQIDWNPEEYVNHPLAHIGTRLFQYLNIQSRTKGWYIDSSGANFAIKGSVYAELQGHRTDLEKGEDSDLGDRLKVLKGEDAIKFAGNRVSLVYTSARRAVDAVLKGKAPIEQWDDEFGAFDDEVRKLPQSETSTVDFDNPDSVKEFLGAVEILINRTAHKMKDWGGRATDRIFERALGWIGINEYELVDDWTIHIKRADTLINNLKAYQTQGSRIQASKTGDKEAFTTLITERKKDKRAEIRNALSSINLNFDFADQYPITPDEIMASPNTIDSDDFIFSLSAKHVLSKNEQGTPQVMLGIDKQSQSVIVAKRRLKEHENWIREQTGALSEISAEETMLGETSLGSPIREISIEEIGDFFIYKKGKSDLFEVVQSGVEIPLPQAIKIVMQLLENLRVLQTKGILHADISPQNILLGYEGDAALIDLESSSMRDSSGQFHKPYGGGVREIFPPELINLEYPLPPSVDTYSLLSILYRLIKGRYPHEINGLSSLGLDEKRLNILYSALHREEKTDYSGIPLGLEKIMEKGLSSNQNDRYDNAADLFNELGKFLLTLDS